MTRPNQYKDNPHPPGSLKAAMWDADRAVRDFGRAWMKMMDDYKARCIRVGRRLRGTDDE